MSRHRNVRNMRYEDELSLDEYGRSYDDVQHYAVSPGTEQQFLYNRAEPKHTLSSFMEEDQREYNEEDDAYESDDNNDALEDSSSSFKMPDLDDTSLAMLQSALEHLEGILGDFFHKPTAVTAVMKHNYNADKALNEILNKG
eukprot:gene4741-5364_t